MKNKVFEQIKIMKYLCQNRHSTYINIIPSPPTADNIYKHIDAEMLRALANNKFI